MKVTYEEKPNQNTYPYFGRYNKCDIDFVVLFSKPTTGFVVKTNSTARPLYQYQDSWAEECFQKLDNFSVTFSVP